MKTKNELKQYKGKIILIKNNLIVVDEINDEFILLSKLESNPKYYCVTYDLLNQMNIDFEQARLNAVNIMNQTKYYNENIEKEKDNIIF